MEKAKISYQKSKKNNHRVYKIYLPIINNLLKRNRCGYYYYLTILKCASTSKVIGAIMDMVNAISQFELKS